MLRILVCLTLLIVTFALSTLPATAQSAADPLLAMLALVPDTPDTRAENSMVSYVDYRAVERAQGITRPATSAALHGDAATQWRQAMLRVSSGPSSLLSYFKVYQTDMPRLVGFDWFDMDRALEYGTPPRIGMILGGTFDSARIGAALGAREFEQTDVEGVTVWHRLEDGRIDLKAREPGDPFGGHLGLAARVAILPGYIANTRHWDMASQIVTTYKQTQKSLMDAPDYRSLAQAVTDPKTFSGSLIQVQFIPVSAVEQVESPDRMPNPPDLKQYGELPAYTLAALADRQEGNMQVHLIAITYPDAGTARRASTELHKRIAGFDPNNTFAEANVTVDEPRVYESDGGAAVAVASIRYPLPDSLDEDGRPRPAGLLFRHWFNALVRRQFYPLALKLPRQPA